MLVVKKPDGWLSVSPFASVSVLLVVSQPHHCALGILVGCGAHSAHKRSFVFSAAVRPSVLSEAVPKIVFHFASVDYFSLVIFYYGVRVAEFPVFIPRALIDSAADGDDAPTVELAF